MEMAVQINCKYCQSENTIKYGLFEGKQRYWCKDCERKFVPDTLPKMKTKCISKNRRGG